MTNIKGSEKEIWRIEYVIRSENLITTRHFRDYKKACAFVDDLKNDDDIRIMSLKVVGKSEVINKPYYV